MLKGKIILGVAFLFWVSILVFMTFFSHNPYLNEILFFFGAMVTITILAYGCESIEKPKKIAKENN